MSQLDRFAETIAKYRQHGWRLARLLMRPETRAESPELGPEHFENVPVKESPVDAAWFARESHAGREAWELRLIGETAYALFETFEPDESEEDREEVRSEMEARLREYGQR